MSIIALIPTITTELLWIATKMLIAEEQRPAVVLKFFKTKKFYVNQIDLIQITALAPSLKKCAARIHAPRLQDLPYKPGLYLTNEQIIILRRYNVNDLDNTGLLYHSLLPQIQLREKMSAKYRVDLRSDSDAQMAEAIIRAEYRRITGKKHVQLTKVEPGTSYNFRPPAYIKFQSALMQYVFNAICASRYYVGNDGGVVLPKEIEEMPVEIAGKKYQFGIGGLHSKEKKVAYVADDEYAIVDTDATSYYPRLILNAGLTPESLGRDFLIIYDGVVVDRVTAKEAKDFIVAECLKIVINGTFGKLGSKWSVVYAPNLLIQVTISGQLSIAMLIERFELNGIEVASINTDGIVVKLLRTKEQLFKAIVDQWTIETGIKTEEVRYAATYSKDVNNYIAVYEKPKDGKLFKTKGLYGETSSKKNAVNEVCIDAIKEYIANGIPMAQTVMNCKKIAMFTTMRYVKGGAVSVADKLYMGKVARWYYTTGEQNEIVDAGSGNRVARSEGAKPCMDLPATLPEDINYEWYINECYDILDNIGYSKAHNLPERNKKAA